MATKKADRIERALEILQTAGAVMRSSAGTWIVRSQRQPNLTYGVGVRSGHAYCACVDFERTGKPCKHVLSSACRPALIAILTFRWARDLEDLRVAAEYHAEALRQQPEAVRAIAREEYEAKRAGFTGHLRVAA
jgi:SWIM zinc finger